MARLDLATEGDAQHFFAAYAEALDKKHDRRSGEEHQRETLSFDTPEGGVFLRCVHTECATLEGGDRSLFEKFANELHWEAPPAKALEKTTAARRAIRDSGGAADGENR
jgi:hypothetical protein